LGILLGGVPKEGLQLACAVLGAVTTAVEKIPWVAGAVVQMGSVDFRQTGDGYHTRYRRHTSTHRTANTRAPKQPPHELLSLPLRFASLMTHVHQARKHSVHCHQKLTEKLTVNDLT
jgi:hypothetical protein